MGARDNKKVGCEAETPPMIPRSNKRQPPTIGEKDVTLDETETHVLLCCRVDSCLDYSPYQFYSENT